MQVILLYHIFINFSNYRSNSHRCKQNIKISFDKRVVVKK